MRPIIALLLALAVTPPARATVVVPADLGDLSREANAIVRGEVVSVEARWTTVERRAIETVVTLDRAVSLKGSPGPQVRFRVPGGRLGRYRSIMIGAPQFAPGQHVIVFLGASGSNLPFVLGFSQGVFRLVPDSGGWIVTPVPVLPVAGPATPIVRGDLARRPMKLAEFEARVRELAGALH
jgi:hypothetical protein